MDPVVVEKDPTLIEPAVQRAEAQGLLALLDRRDQFGQVYADLRESIEGLVTAKPVDVGMRGRNLAALYQTIIAKEDPALSELASACASLSHTHQWRNLTLSHC